MFIILRGCSSLDTFAQFCMIYFHENTEEKLKKKDE